jgi:hypothetical protein
MSMQSMNSDKKKYNANTFFSMVGPSKTNLYKVFENPRVIVLLSKSISSNLVMDGDELNKVDQKGYRSRIRKMLY